MKRLIQFGTAILIALMYAWFFAPFAGQAGAYQPPVLQVVQEMQNKYPDIWKGCGDECVKATLKGNGWWVEPLAAQKGISSTVVAQYAVTWSYDWGIRFEQTRAANTDCLKKSTSEKNLCAPAMDDWVAAYADNIAQIGYAIQASPQIFAVNDWSDSRYFRVKQEYGGPF